MDILKMLADLRAEREQIEQAILAIERLATRTRGNYLLGLRPVAAKGDTFDEDRVGLDHLSFKVESRAALDAAIKVLDERGVTHGAVRELTSFGICVLPFRDPDNIQLEITSPL